MKNLFKICIVSVIIVLCCTACFADSNKVMFCKTREDSIIYFSLESPIIFESYNKGQTFRMIAPQDIHSRVFVSVSHQTLLNMFITAGYNIIKID